MSDKAAVCVLIATLATSERRPYLLRALASLRAQRQVATRAIVAINGGQADPAIVAELGRMPGITLLHRPEPSLPGALAAARRLVDTACFAQLDDDDELLPHALAARLARMNAPDRPDAVVTNGFVRNGATETMSIPDVAAVERDPVAALLEQNWLLPGAALFRSDTIDASFFESTPRFLEWTYVALRLALRHRVAVLAEPTLIHYQGLPFSVNLSREGALLRPLAFGALLELELPPEIRRGLRLKRGAAWHTAAETRRLAGERRLAWTAHLKSLAGPGGWRYLAYTRHLLAPGARRARAAAVADRAKAAR